MQLRRNRRRPNRRHPRHRNRKRRKSKTPPNTTPTSARCSSPIQPRKSADWKRSLSQYPNSVMKEDALELLMGTYQQSNNQAKVIDTANRLLAANPDNARALVLLAYNERATQKWADAKQHAERGLQAVAKMAKPDGVSDADFTKQKAQLSGLLNSVAGFSVPAVEGLSVCAKVSPAGGRS